MGKVLAIGLSYFVLSLYYTIFNSLPARNKHADDPYNTLFSLSVFLLAGVDTTFYCWTFLSINNILTGLAVRKQAAKYLLYKNFRTVLFVSLMANCVWVLYGSVIHLNTETGEDSNWKDRWTVDALWEITYFLIFVAIAIMWAPSKNFSNYAYSVELSQLDDDAEYNQTAVEAEENTEQQDQKGDTDDAEYGGRLNDEVSTRRTFSLRFLHSIPVHLSISCSLHFHLSISCCLSCPSPSFFISPLFLLSLLVPLLISRF